MALSSKEKKLIKNTGILAIGTLLSKILSFFLLPIYTAYLSTKDYGNVDVLQTVASLLIPFVSLELTSASFRFLIDYKNKKSREEIITTTTFIIFINSCLFVIIASIINYFVHVDYFILFLVYFISLIFHSHMQFIIRGFENNILFSILSFISTLVTLVLNILLIVVLKWEANSILIAHIVANTLSIIIACVYISIWKYIKIKTFSISILKDLLKYSLPLIPNAISWWISNTSDRLIIRWIIGSNANGIYAIANKIPQIYTTFFNVYNLAWVESVSKEINNLDSQTYINEMFKKSIKLFGCICIGIISVISITHSFLLGNNYSSAYNHIFILMIAIFFNSMCSIIGSILTALKKSKSIGLTTTLGAIINIIVNLALIKYIGLYAASISTLVSYIVIFVLRYKEVRKYIKLEFPVKYIIYMIISLFITSCAYFIRNNYFSIIILVYLIIWSFKTNQELIVETFKSVAKKFKIILRKKEKV